VDRRSVGSGGAPLDQLLASGVVAQRKYVRRQRNAAEEGRAKEVERKDRVVGLIELPLLQGVFELLL
jgi:hypothetical protein